MGARAGGWGWESRQPSSCACVCQPSFSQNLAATLSGFDKKLAERKKTIVQWWDDGADASEGEGEQQGPRHHARAHTRTRASTRACPAPAPRSRTTVRTALGRALKH